MAREGPDALGEVAGEPCEQLAAGAGERLGAGALRDAARLGMQRVATPRRTSSGSASMSTPGAANGHGSPSQRSGSSGVASNAARVDTEPTGVLQAELGGELELRDGAVVEREAVALERGVLDAVDGELPVEVLAMPGDEFGERLVALRASRTPFPRRAAR